MACFVCFPSSVRALEQIDLESWVSPRAVCTNLSFQVSGCLHQLNFGFSSGLQPNDFGPWAPCSLWEPLMGSNQLDHGALVEGSFPFRFLSGWFSEAWNILTELLRWQSQCNQSLWASRVNEFVVFGCSDLQRRALKVLSWPSILFLEILYCGLEIQFHGIVGYMAFLFIIITYTSWIHVPSQGCGFGFRYKLLPHQSVLPAKRSTLDFTSCGCSVQGKVSCRSSPIHLSDLSPWCSCRALPIQSVPRVGCTYFEWRPPTCIQIDGLSSFPVQLGLLRVHWDAAGGKHGWMF